MIKVAVPAGIGDFLWIWCKLSTVENTEFCFFTPDTFPQRTLQFFSLIPNIKGKLGKHNYDDILLEYKRRGSPKTWQQYLEAFGEDIIYLEANKHLEEGKPLSEWLPDLQTNYYPEIIYDKEYKKFNIPTLAIHCASMRGIRNWNAWLPETWAEFLKLFIKEFPDWQIMALGGYWDIDTIQELKGLLPEDFPLIDLVGKTSIYECVSILNVVDYYIGFSSGLNCIRCALGKPTAALWPKHQYLLMYSWVDPKMIQNRNYMGFLYDSPERIFNRIKSKVKEIQYICL